MTVSPEPYSLQALTGTAFKLDLAGVFGLTGSHGLGLLEILFVFLFVDLFDNIGTLVAVTKRAGLMDKAGKIPGLNRILITDATATIRRLDGGHTAPSPPMSRARRACRQAGARG